MPARPPRSPLDIASIFAGLKTAVSEIVEDAAKEGLKHGVDGFLGVLEENANGVVQRIAGARGKVRTKTVHAAAPLERGPEVVQVRVEGEPRKRKTKRKSARRR
jgi:hypothetical protein